MTVLKSVRSGQSPSNFRLRILPILLFWWYYDCLYCHLNIDTSDHNMCFCKLISHLNIWYHTLFLMTNVFGKKKKNLEGLNWGNASLVSLLFLSIDNWMKDLSVYFLLVARWYHLSTAPKEWIRFFYVPNFGGG